MARPGLHSCFLSPEKQSISEAEYQGFLLINTPGTSKSGNEDFWREDDRTHAQRHLGVTEASTWRQRPQEESSSANWAPVSECGAQLAQGWSCAPVPSECKTCRLPPH